MIPFDVANDALAIMDHICLATAHEAFLGEHQLRVARDKAKRVGKVRIQFDGFDWSIKFY